VSSISLPITERGDKRRTDGGSRWLNKERKGKGEKVANNLTYARIDILKQTVVGGRRLDPQKIGLFCPVVAAGEGEKEGRRKSSICVVVRETGF